jgi:hypothetical protein
VYAFVVKVAATTPSRNRTLRSLGKPGIKTIVENHKCHSDAPTPLTAVYHMTKF